MIAPKQPVLGTALRALCYGFFPCKMVYHWCFHSWLFLFGPHCGVRLPRIVALCVVSNSLAIVPYLEHRERIRAQNGICQQQRSAIHIIYQVPLVFGSCEKI